MAGRKNKNKFPMIAGGVLLTSVILYCLGITAPYFVALTLVFTLGASFPSSIKSYASRFFVSALLILSLLQAASLVQFYLLPHTRFPVLAAITGVLVWTVVVVLHASPEKAKQPEKVSWFDKNDVCAWLCAAVLVIPAAGLLLMSSGTRLALTGSIQGIDGANHYAMIAEMSSAQHLDYKDNYYYPKGFQIATAFVQDSLGIGQHKLGWMAGARLYFAQYIFFGALLLMSLFYFASFFARGPSKASVFGRLGAALALGVVISLFYIGPFVYHGFLNYLYILTVLAVGALYLIDDEKQRSKLMSTAIFLVLGIGVSASWPLFVPSLLITAALVLLSERKTVLSKGGVKATWPILLLVGGATGFHLVTIYTQMTYAITNSGQSMTPGGIRAMHTVLLAALFVVFLVVTTTKLLEEHVRVRLQQVFIPLIFSLLSIALMQYFLLDEVRYYAIKIAVAIEVLLIALVVGIMIRFYTQVQKSNTWYALFMIPLASCFIVTLLVSQNGSPLHDMRYLFSGASGVVYSPRFNDDVAGLTRLRAEGKFGNGNVITMHVSTEGVLNADPQAFYWASVLEYSGAPSDHEGFMCGLGVYQAIVDQKPQSELTRQIEKCVTLAKQGDRAFYIVTDTASRGRLQELFGNIVEIKT